jgi:hypothetical protein
MPSRKPIGDAAEDAATHLGISIGAAKMKLIDACHAGVIRAYWKGHYSGQSPLFTRQDWEGADIDVSCNTAVLANGERRAFVEVDRDDYEAWVNSKPAPPRSVTRRIGYKTQLAREAAASIWGVDGPPDGLPPQQIFKMVGDKVQELHDIRICKTQVLRALK